MNIFKNLFIKIGSLMGLELQQKDLTTKTIVEGNNEYYNVTNFDFNTKILTYDDKNIKIEI